MLDNIDPLFSGEKAEETAGFLNRVLTECTEIRILSTCRTQLRLGGYESDFLVDPLNDWDAIELFVDSIPDRGVRAEVKRLPPEDREEVKKLVSGLEGHPLSIFLAAHRIVAGPEPVARQLREVRKNLVKFLDAPELRGMPDRQKSLRASLALSYEMLSERGKEIFRKSSMFPGGLYRSAETLDGLLGTDWREFAHEVFGIGLSRFERDEQRYWMLNPVREYGEDLLAAEEGDRFGEQVAGFWEEFTGANHFLLNPAKNPEWLAELELPAEPEERRAMLVSLHEKAFAALSAAETNILFSFRWAVDNHAEAAERIANNLMDYLGLCGKLQTNAWMARAALDACKDPAARAKWLNNLGTRLSELGDRRGALTAAEDALDLYRKLAEKHPEPFLPELATSLNNLGVMLSGLGDGQGALTATREALDLYRKLAEKHPEAFLPYVAGSLSNLGSGLSELGDRQGALTAAEEALDLYRKLAEKHPEAFLPDFAKSLNNLGNRLAESGTGRGRSMLRRKRLKFAANWPKNTPRHICRTLP